MKNRIIFTATLLAISLLSCNLDSEWDLVGIRKTPPGIGPKVIFDPFTKPMAEVPFPNNVATRYDADSPTGLRLNFPTDSPTKMERHDRETMNQLAGFGVFSPITVSFDEPLDLTTITRDNIRVINISPARKANPCTHPRCPESLKYGAAARLDLGDGFFTQLVRPFDYHPSDPLADVNNLLFAPSEYEFNYADGAWDRHWVDRDGDEEVFYGNERDLNEDGVFDQYRELITHYEFETNTIIARPVVPLDQRATYAVVITEGIKGLDGMPIRSPFPYVNHLSQTEDLRVLIDENLLAKLDPPLSVNDIAFAWTFTTQDITGDLVAIQKGLKGKGKFSALADQNPALLSEVTSLGEEVKDNKGGDPSDNVYILQPEVFEEIVALIVDFMGENVSLSFESVDHFVFGKYSSPDFRAPEDHLFHVNPLTGEYKAGKTEVTWMLSVPKETDEYKQPFPVILDCHGTGLSRIEIIAIANNMAKRGLAMFAIDAVSHGPIYDITNLEEISSALPADMSFSLVVKLVSGILGLDLDVSGLSDEDALEKLMEVGLIRAMFGEGRAEDVDADGWIENGAGFWTPDAFEARDVVRQTVVDFMQAARIVQNFGSESQFDYNEDGTNDLDGDFDADGIIDVGGPENSKLMTSGVSLGGITSSVVLGAAEDVITGAPVVPGGGLIDMAVRSTLHGVTKYMMHQIIGPIIVGRYDSASNEGVGEGEPVSVVLSWNDERRDFARVLVTPGDYIRATNLANGEVRTVMTGPDGVFSVGLPCDFSDPVKIEVINFETEEITATVDRVNLILKEGEDPPKADRPEIIWLDTTYALDPDLIDIEEGYVILEQPLTAISQGTAYPRNSPDFRRFVGIGQMVFDPADPINWAPHFFIDPLPGREIKNVLFEMAPGDTTVPHPTGLALAHATGLITEEEMLQLIANGDMLLFDAWYKSHQYGGGENQYVYDIDDLDENNEESVRSDGSTMPAPVGPLTPVDNTDIGGGYSTVRFPYDPRNHSFVAAPSSSGRSFADFTVYSQKQMAEFFAFTGAPGAKPEQAVVDCFRDEIDCTYGRSVSDCTPCPILPPPK